MALPLGVQLTTIGSEADFFWKLRDVMLEHNSYRLEYDALKSISQGLDMEEYRRRKNDFFDRLMQSEEYLRLG